MATTEELQARLAKLKKARDTGVLTVRHGDVTTTFRTLAELEGIIGALEADIASSAGTRIVRGYRFVSSKGL